jgi:hypothetical protein
MNVQSIGAPANPMELSGQRFPLRLPWPLAILLTVTSLTALASVGAVGVAHLRDGYQLDHVSGVWMALASDTADGVLYRPVYDGKEYGGSRYMPGYFALLAALTSRLGDAVLAGKVLSLGAALAGFLLAYVVLRFLGCSWLVSLGLASVIAVSTGFFNATVGIRGDLLPLILQLAALTLAHHGQRVAHLFAGVLCGLAILCKLSALWAPAAILCCALYRERRDFLVFLVGWVVSLVAGFASLYILSDGRIVESASVFADPSFASFLLMAPLRLFRIAAGMSPCLVLLIPFAVVECLRGASERQVNVIHVGFCFCILTTTMLFADRGTTANHLVDLELLVVLLTGSLWTAAEAIGTSQRALRAVLGVAVIWLLVVLWTKNLGQPTRDLVGGWLGEQPPAYPAKPLAGVIQAGSILSEDPRVSLAHGQKPVVLDPYALPFLKKTQPEAVAALVERIRQREFRYVVLQYRLDVDPEINDGWYNIIFGRDVSTAIRENYQLERLEDGYCVFGPSVDR